MDKNELRDVIGQLINSELEYVFADYFTFRGTFEPNPSCIWLGFRHNPLVRFYCESDGASVGVDLNPPRPVYIGRDSGETVIRDLSWSSL